MDSLCPLGNLMSYAILRLSIIILLYNTLIKSFKEMDLGPILGPLSHPPSDHFHCSPLLTRPKDSTDRRIILNLSYPHGKSVNDFVDKDSFNGSKFILKLPTIDDIVSELNELGNGALLGKIDVARAFRNLRVDPADALKFGIKWDNKYILDSGITFGWVHGRSAFQMVSDAVTYVMAKRHHKILAYIDDYIIIAPHETANQAFDELHQLLSDLGLPINKKKVSVPCRALTCLGICVNLDDNTLSTDESKLQSILNECQKFVTKKHTTKKGLQSQFNGITCINKTVIPEDHTLHVDASLTGLGGVWSNRVYASPIIQLTYFDLKIVHLAMLNILVALRKWKHFWLHSTLKIFCGNKAVVKVVESGKTKDSYLAACIRNIWLLTATYDINLSVQHIQGAHNVIADCLSRLYSHKPTDLHLLKILQDNYIWDKVLTEDFKLDFSI